MEVCQGQFVYLTDKHVLSNAWAGRLFVEHQVPGACRLAMSNALDFLVVGEGQSVLFEGRQPVLKWDVGGKGVLQAAFDRIHKRYLLLADTGYRVLGHGIHATGGFGTATANCSFFTDDGRALLIGTSDGWFYLDADSLELPASHLKRLPCTDIRCVSRFGDATWFGTPKGAFALHVAGRIDHA